MLRLKDSIYEKIKHLSGIIRVQNAFEILKQSNEVITERNPYGMAKETMKLNVDGNKFVITKGYTGKFEVGMYSGERKIIGISTIEETKDRMIKGEFGIKLKDPRNPEWKNFVEEVVAKKCMAEFKIISNICISMSAIIGVQILTLSDQASSGCLLVDTPFNIFISILRLMVGKPSLYESISFYPIHDNELQIKLMKARELTYGELTGSKTWAKDILLIDLIHAYLQKNVPFAISSGEFCALIQEISEILNKSIYYGENSKYMRIIKEDDIRDFEC